MLGGTNRRFTYGRDSGGDSTQAVPKRSAKTTLWVVGRISEAGTTQIHPGRATRAGYRVEPGTTPHVAERILELRDGKDAKETLVFGARFDAPAWRIRTVIGLLVYSLVAR